jgi:arylsulfatase A-like enzyme
LRTWKLDGWDWNRWAPIVGRYLGDISLLDAQIGRVLEVLDGLGLTERTLVVYTSDHGDMCGAHGMIDKHFIMYDDVLRVPMIVRWPGLIEPGRTCDEFVINSLDLPTTFLELAGLPVPSTFKGTGLVPALRGSGGTGRQDVFAMYHGNQFGLFSQRMVRDRRWKYVWNATAEDELYDLADDPAELHNLARDRTHAAELARLRHRLIQWMDEIGDRLLNRWTRTQIGEGLTE